jgi:hypothetical protein
VNGLGRLSFDEAVFVSRFEITSGQRWHFRSECSSSSSSS